MSEREREKGRDRLSAFLMESSCSFGDPFAVCRISHLYFSSDEGRKTSIRKPNEIFIQVSSIKLSLLSSLSLDEAFYLSVFATFTFLIVSVFLFPLVAFSSSIGRKK